jgi:hypothetical protein
MATITSFLAGNYGPRAVGSPFVSYSRLDFAKNPVAASDVVQIVEIPAGTLVINVFCTVITAEGATCTATLGDGADADGWDVSVNLNATAGTITYGIAGTDAYVNSIGTAQGKIYTSADTLDFVMGHATDAAVIDVRVVGWNVTT